MEEVLRTAGRPLTRSDLRAALGLAASDATLFHSMVGCRPFAEVSSRMWGLVDRDVPGGEAAFDMAIAALEEKQCTTPECARVLIRDLSAKHALWSEELAASAYRTWKAERNTFPPEKSAIIPR